MDLSLRCTLTLLMALLLPVCLHAQQASEPDPADYAKVSDVLPPSPNSASLGKYGGVEIGRVSGTISHSLPLYTLSSYQLQVPVSLSYSSNGLRVDEISSRVGTGWNLNAGGVITRTV